MSITLDPAERMLRELAQWAFPDAEITDREIQLIALALVTSRRPELAAFRDRRAPAPPSPQTPRQGVQRAALEALLTGTYTTYNAHATHLRTSPIYSCFDGPMQAVRVPLKQSHTPTFSTPIGDVFGFDHLMYSIDDVAQKFGDQIDGSFERVDLVTGARHDLLRFSPVSIYFGYEKQDSPLPFFFVLEAATVFGTPKVLYLGKTMDSVLFYPVGYKPTPFSSPSYFYRSTLSMNGNEPDTLIIEGLETPTSKPYITITMVYQVDAEPPAPTFAGDQIIDAILRVAGIAEGMGYDLNIVERWVANQGLDHLPWFLNPENNITGSGD